MEDLGETSLLPLCQMHPALAARFDTVYSDIDDTLTTEGLVPALAFDALWRARRAGLSVVLVTGRPAGWCDHIARMWPVSGVIGENGALAFAMREGSMRRLYADRPSDAAARLDAIRSEVLSEVPGCKVSADQAYREFDLAIDFCEEVEPLDEQAIGQIVAIFERAGATAKVSSIHVNGWFGAFDKLSMCRRYAATLAAAELDPERATFIGDSPNDEPMFRFFSHSCGVANVRSMAHRMSALPRYVTRARGGEGFAELIAHLLSSRAL